MNMGAGKDTYESNNANRIKHALEIAKGGAVDGDRHKMWIIDQMVRALTGCPFILKKALGYNGVPYEYEMMGESDEYIAWLQAYSKGEEGPHTCQWDIGVPP